MRNLPRFGVIVAICSLVIVIVIGMVALLHPHSLTDVISLGLDATRTPAAPGDPNLPPEIVLPPDAQASATAAAAILEVQPFANASGSVVVTPLPANAAPAAESRAIGAGPTTAPASGGDAGPPALTSTAASPGAAPAPGGDTTEAPVPGAPQPTAARGTTPKGAPTATSRPPSTATPVLSAPPTATARIPTSTPPPSPTPLPPTRTPLPTSTPAPPTRTPLPPTRTPLPTSTPAPPTRTPLPPPTATPRPTDAAPTTNRHTTTPADSDAYFVTADTTTAANATVITPTNLTAVGTELRTGIWLQDDLDFTVLFQPCPPLNSLSWSVTSGSRNRAGR